MSRVRVPASLGAHLSRVLLLIYLTAPAAGGTAKGGSLGITTNDSRKLYTLHADATWQLNPPAAKRFDASALAFFKGKLLTLNDRGPELFQVVLGTNSADLKPTLFFPRALVARALGTTQDRFDCEGLAVDSANFLYLCEESGRNVYRSSPDGRKVERLPIDWSPVKKFFKGGSNASFEGITVGNGRLYLANERDEARIIEVDLASLAVLDSFFVDSPNFALGGPHYCDLAFYDGALFVLDRNHRAIFEVDPASKTVRAEYSYGAMELRDDVAYKTDYPTGTMEGLAVDHDHFWLVTDNNGKPRFHSPNDFRPTLFRVPRPR